MPVRAGRRRQPRDRRSSLYASRHEDRDLRFLGKGRRRDFTHRRLTFPRTDEQGLASVMQIIASYIIASLVAFAPSSHAARASLTSATHGEATVYIAGNFTRDFDVSYVIILDGQSKNRSFTTIGMMMIGATD